MSWTALSPILRWLALRKAMPVFAAGEIAIPGAQKCVKAAPFIAALFPDAGIQDNCTCPVSRIWEWASRNKKENDVLLFMEWLIAMNPTAVAEFLADSSELLAPEERASWIGRLPDDERADMLDRIAAEWIVRRDPAGATSPLTRSQAAAHRRLKVMAELFFRTAGCGGALRPRFMPLLLGPTGAGKSSLLKRIADELGAKFFRASGGEWIPVGAKDSRATVLAILDLLAANNRVVVMIDELDKITGDTGTSWARSVQNEMFAVLDRALPIDSYVKAERIPEPLVDELRSKVGKGLFICAAGTWQHLLDSPSRAGFGIQENQSHGEIFARVLKDRVVPKELLMRFTLPPIVLEYPSQAETQQLYDELGISRLAKAAGSALDPATHDWTRGGMRSLENLSAELLIRIHEREAGT